MVLRRGTVLPLRHFRPAGPPDPGGGIAVWLLTLWDVGVASPRLRGLGVPTRCPGRVS